MIPILYQSVAEGTVPTDYGIGPLTDCLSAEVTESRNGGYELTLSYAVNGIHAEEIEPNRIIKAKPNYTDAPQLFRIYKVGKQMNGRFEVNAQHISYDLSGKIISSGTASSCVAACTLLQAQAGNFTITTDKTVSASFKITEPSSVRSWFGGKEGSLLDVFGTAEWKYDNYSCSLKLNRGMDRGVQIRYGKNLTELSQTLDMSNLVTGIVPFYKDNNGNVTTGTKVSTGLTLDVARDLAVDFSSDVDPESATPILTQLSNLATRYISNNNFTVAFNNITLDAVQMKDLSERVDLCDTVHIFFEALGINASAKCIETTWDVINERYTKIGFGDSRTNISDVIANTQKVLSDTPSNSFMQQAINHATELITGNLGGYVILHDSNGDGEPDEILIMDSPDISSSLNIWRWNQSGLGFSSTGYAGPYGTAITSDGKIVADYILTGTLNANLIKAGIISDVNNNSSIDMTSGVATLKNMKAKQSFELIDSNGVKRGFFQYIENAGEPHLGVVSASNEALAEIWGDSVGGKLRLQKPNGNDMALLASTSDGGSLTIYDDSNSPRVVLWVDGYDHGNIYLYNESYEAKIKMYGSGEITCVSLTQTSSRKVKENICPIADSEKILELEAVSFDFKNKNEGTNKRGFIAEDVQKVLPNLVSPESEDQPMSLNYLEMIPYLQDVIKKQEERIKVLEDKINKLGG